jgi:hypothetical protein
LSYKLNHPIEAKLIAKHLGTSVDSTCNVVVTQVGPSNLASDGTLTFTAAIDAPQVDGSLYIGPIDCSATNIIGVSNPGLLLFKY